MHKIRSRYALKRLPFTKEVELPDLFLPESLQEAKARLQAAVKAKASAVLTGDPGTGKTFLLRAMETDLNPARFRVTYIHNARVKRRDFYRQLSVALGLEPKTTAPALFRNVQDHFEELAQDQKVHPVLVLDEAHLLSLSVLEHLHILLNFQKDSRSFLSLLLVGLPHLREILQRNLLSSLAARLPVRIHLEPLEREEIDAYLRHRMIVAGSPKEEIFTEEACLFIREATGGVMRKIDVLALTCLKLTAEKKKTTLVDGKTVREALKLCAEVLR